MSTEPIKDVLNSGKCPRCDASIVTDDKMTSYFCESDKSHFLLEVVFHGGEKMTATLNGNPVPQDELEELEW